MRLDAVINYQSSAVARTLVRNGAVFAERDVTGTDKRMVGHNPEPHTVEIHNGRLKQLTLDANAFTCLSSPIKHVDYYNQAEVVGDYYSQCEQLLRDTTGASFVAAFDHNVRSASDTEKRKKITGGNLVQGPAAMCHGDYTLFSGPQRLQDLAKPPKTNDTLRAKLGEKPLVPPELAADVAAGKRRFAIINVWRPVTSYPVESKPLALLDAASASADDLSVFEIHYVDRIGENYYGSHNEKHRWYYFPRMTRDEAILLKTFDSKGSFPAAAAPDGSTVPASAGAPVVTPTAVANDDTAAAVSTFALHTAIEEPDPPQDARDRESIEVRCVVVY